MRSGRQGKGCEALVQAFWMKACNLVLLAALLIGYQGVVNSRAQEETIAELQQELAVQKAAAAAAQPEEESGTDSPYADGTYTGEAEGYGGLVSVEITIADGEITDVTVLSAEQEDAAYFDAARGVIDEILEQQTTDVDTISGATFSSNGILHAVEEALGKAEQNT